MKKTSLLTLIIISLIPALLLAQPTNFNPAGVSGGGAVYTPTFNPANPNNLFVVCDMGPYLESMDNGITWRQKNYTDLTVNNLNGEMRFTSDPQIMYNLQFMTKAYQSVPVVSNDAGATWQNLSVPFGYDATTNMMVDQSTTGRFIITDDNSIYYTSNGGTNYVTAFTYPGTTGIPYLAITGSFWDGDNIYISSNIGLLVSTNGGITFSVDPANGFPAGKGMISMAGSKQNGVTRLMVTIANQSEMMYPYTEVDDLTTISNKVYVRDYGVNSWTTALSVTQADFSNVAASQGDISTFYASGFTENGYFGIVYKTTDGGANWTSVLKEGGNQNIKTGYAGEGSTYFDWGWDGLIHGLTVASNNPDRIMAGGFGFLHISEDGGTTWRQSYVNPESENPMGSIADPNKVYKMNGLNVTVLWDVFWADQNNMIAGYTDITAWRSNDGGESWLNNDTGNNYNTTYQTIANRTNDIIYAAVSGLHNIYLFTTLDEDDQLVDDSGEILYSTNNGQDWLTLKNFNDPVLSIAIDPNNVEVMYASVFNKTTGGIYKTTNLSAGAGATWQKMTNPPRTQEHPFNVKVLNDGALVVAYSARINNNVFTASSGVFYSTDGGTTWADRSHAGMQYYTKDITIDPHDVSQNIWYVAVQEGPEDYPETHGKNGLYKTTDRGLTWTKIWANHDIESVTIHPENPDVMYISTWAEGLWYTNTLTIGGFSPVHVDSYPFSHPIRTFVNPYDGSDLWIVSNGASIMRGSAPNDPLPTSLSDFRGQTNGESVTLFWNSADSAKLTGFKIDHKFDAGWNQEAFMPATQNQALYSHRMDNLAKGSHKFRISAVDLNGSVIYSSVIEAVVLPEDGFSLSQNYPNPFADKTTLSFSLSEAGIVSLEVYDLIGRRIQMVLSGYKPAGVHNAIINAENLPSGVYFCRLSVDGRPAKMQRIIVAK